MRGHYTRTLNSYCLIPVHTVLLVECFIHVTCLADEVAQGPIICSQRVTNWLEGLPGPEPERQQHGPGTPDHERDPALTCHRQASGHTHNNNENADNHEA